MAKQKMAGNYRSPTVIYRYIHSNLICLLFVNVRKNKVNEKSLSGDQEIGKGILQKEMMVKKYIKI